MNYVGFVICAFLLGMITMDFIVSRDMNKEKNRLKDECRKMNMYYHIFNLWLDMRQQGKKIDDYMKTQGYKRVAIYGMKELGERLYVELVNAGVEVVCVIDSNKNILGNFPLLSPNDEIPPVDLVIVTASFYFSEIESALNKKVSCPIVSLEGLLGNAFRRNL